LKKYKAENNKTVWLTIPQSAEICGLSDGAFRHDYRPKIPKGKLHEKKQGVTVYLNGQTVVKTLFDAREESRARAGKLSKSADATIMDGGALERLRDEKAQIAKLERLERERSLIPRDEIHDLMNQLAGILRSAGECLQRTHGNGAQQILDDAIDSFEREVKRSLDS